MLDADHYGLEKIKQRIVEYLAVRKLAPEGKAPILCFVGPPGVGKTSLGQSIARAMGRKFARVSLGGVHDEAEIRGHRRTYIGALPGNIIQAIRKAGCARLRDDARRDRQDGHRHPRRSVVRRMLEVLDPEQNSTFRDNYLDVPFDLSRVVFITTANMLDTIPGPLRDRMEIIALTGYTAGEKLEIAKRYLVRRQLEANGLKPEQVEIDDAALRRIIDELHARGRRAQPRARDRPRAAPRRGRDRRGRDRQEADRRRGPGEDPGPGALRERGRDAHQRAGRGDGARLDAGRRRHPVHRGDAHAGRRPAAPDRPARRGDARERPGGAQPGQEPGGHAQIDPALFEKSDIHVHVPAGATPKDGPSAGVAMFMALTSLLTGRTIRSDTAMTGEISLRGLVLPVGGIKEKVVAAAAAGITRVMLPARNKRDYDDIPEEVRKQLEFVWLEQVDDAVAQGLQAAG